MYQFGLQNFKIMVTRLPLHTLYSGCKISKNGDPVTITHTYRFCIFFYINTQVAHPSVVRN